MFEDFRSSLPSLDFSAQKGILSLPNFNIRGIGDKIKNSLTFSNTPTEEITESIGPKLAKLLDGRASEVNTLTSFMTGKEQTDMDIGYENLAAGAGSNFEAAQDYSKMKGILHTAQQTKDAYDNKLQSNADRIKQIEEGYVPGLNRAKKAEQQLEIANKLGNKDLEKDNNSENRKNFNKINESYKTAQNRTKSIESYGYKNNKAIVDEAKKDYAEKVKQAEKNINSKQEAVSAAQEGYKKANEEGKQQAKTALDDAQKDLEKEKGSFYAKNKGLLTTTDKDGNVIRGAEEEYKEARREAQREYREQITNLQARNPGMSRKEILEKQEKGRAESVNSAVLKKMQARMGEGTTKEEAANMINNIRRAQLNRTQQGIIDNRLAENKRLQTEEGKAEFVASHRGENGEFVKKARTLSPANKMVEKPGGWGKGKMALAAGVGAAVIGGLASLGTARMMMAGGTQPNSNLYNPYQSSY